MLEFDRLGGAYGPDEGFKALAMPHSFTGLPGGTEGFQGNFDGKSKKIKNLYIKALQSDYYASLFAVLAQGATIKNLQLTNLYIESIYEMGGLVAVNLGVIDNCDIDGQILAARSAGGIVFDNYGTIKNSNAAVDVGPNCYQCNGEYFGGIVASNNGIITNCHATGDITGGGTVSKPCLGSLVGSSVNGITASSGIGTVTCDISPGYETFACWPEYITCCPQSYP